MLKIVPAIIIPAGKFDVFQGHTCNKHGKNTRSAGHNRQWSSRHYNIITCSSVRPSSSIDCSSFLYLQTTTLYNIMISHKSCQMIHSQTNTIHHSVLPITVTIQNISSVVSMTLTIQIHYSVFINECYHPNNTIVSMTVPI